MRSTIRLAGVFALLFTATAFAQEPPRLPPGLPPMGDQAAADEPAAPKDVTIKTADGLKLGATYWSAETAGGAGVVLLHMYGSDRSAWGPVVKPLRARDVAILAIDLRGHGDSAMQGKKDLGKKVKSRDAKLFAAMHKDAAAGIEWLVKEGECDAKRIALVGASVGCSVAIDTARRKPDAVAAVLCMTPGAKYLGLDTLSHLETFSADTPLLLMTHRDENEVGTQKIMDARPTTHVVVYDDDAPESAGAERAWAHGTRMFGRLPLAARTVASFVAAKTGSEADDVVLDGIVTLDGPARDPWTRATSVLKPGAAGKLRAYRVGRRLVFSGITTPRVGGLRFFVQTGPEEGAGGGGMIGPPQVVCVDLSKGRVEWSWGGMGSMPDFPGMDTSNIFGKTRPVLRVVRAEGETTFEGEWIVPAMGDSDDAISLLGVFDSTPRPAPRGGAVSAELGAVVVPAR